MEKRTECPFCNPQQRVLKENEHAYVLLSDPRKVAGHFLVIPKRHIEKPWEAAREEITSVFELIAFVQQKIIGQIAEGCDVRQHYRPFLAQSKFKVDHIHYHIIPRAFEDTLYHTAESFETTLFADLPQEEHDRIAQLLKD